MQACQQTTRVAHIGGAALGAACISTLAGHSRGSYQRAALGAARTGTPVYHSRGLHQQDCARRCLFFFVFLIDHLLGGQIRSKFRLEGLVGPSPWRAYHGRTRGGGK